MPEFAQFWIVMMDNLILLWLAAFPLMGSPGPATLGLASVGNAYGLRGAMPYFAGVVLGTTVVLVLIASGITVVILTMPMLVRVLSGVAACYILVLAWKIATAPVGAGKSQTKNPPTLVSGLILAIANPKAFAAIGAVYVGRALIENNVIADSLAKLLALFLVIVVVGASWLLFGAVFSRLLSHPTSGRIANCVFAFLLVTSVGFALASL